MGQVDSSDLLIYTRPETEVIVSSLHTAKDGLALWNFYQERPYLFTDPSYASDCLLFGYVFALFSTKHYEMMFKIISESNFDKRHFKDLHEYWFEGHYHQYMEKTKKPYLTSIMKFRVRAKNPVPSSIFDEAMKWGTRQSVQKELLKAYEGTSFYFGVEELAKKTGHTKKQVSNWFKNRRSRDRRKEQDEFLQNYYNMDACTSRLVEDTSLYPPNIYHSG